MRFLLFVLALCASIGMNAQTFKIDTTSLPGKYSMEGRVKVENGHEDTVEVKVTALVPSDIWVKFRKQLTDSAYFCHVFQMITIDAKYQLKNTLSFVPLNNFFMWYDKSSSFMSNYKMMGKNGYGIESETQALSYYKPTP